MKSQTIAVTRERRHARIRTRVKGTGVRPRFCVFKSNKYIYTQLIDDTAGHTLVSASTKGFSGTMAERSALLGKKIAELAKTKKISSVVFDRGGYRYTGNVKAVADGARAGGLIF